MVFQKNENIGKQTKRKNGPGHGRPARIQRCEHCHFVLPRFGFHVQVNRELVGQISVIVRHASFPC